MENFKRIFNAGAVNFWRNGWLSTATVGVMVLALLMVMLLIFILIFTYNLSSELQNKVDISAYFKPDTKESSILRAKEDLEGLAQVKSVSYVSQDDALYNFKEKHKNDPVSLQALAELENNPFEASLNVSSKDIKDYQFINDYIYGHYQDILDNVNYPENQSVINKISSFITGIRIAGFVITIVLALIALLVSFNTIRLVIYTSREEISIMRLVGATNWFVRGPFLVNGFLQGIIASFFALLISWPIIYYFSPKIKIFMPSTDFNYYFTSHLFIVYLILLFTGIGIGVLGSALAIRRYLKEY
jgi:cell division transport system permease protein